MATKSPTPPPKSRKPALTAPALTPEEQRLEADLLRQAQWKRWGPYLSERQWGTVREDYSASGDAWNYLPFEQAQSRAYRWGEDGLGGISDRRQLICFALALWNGCDPILKERLFGLSNGQGNHGEDVKEYYFYLDNTPTHSYLRCLYKYPQAEFPYRKLIDENAGRSRLESEYELLDTGIFDDDRYFDVEIEYAKASPEDILIRISATNRGPDSAGLHLLPTVWYRNTWSWFPQASRPSLSAEPAEKDAGSRIHLEDEYYGSRWLLIEGPSELLFTENETNFERLWGVPNRSPYVKDAFHDFVIAAKHDAVNPAATGTKAAAYRQVPLAPGETFTWRLRLTDTPPASGVGADFDAVFDQRKQEAAEFYAKRVPPSCGPDGTNIQHQAFAGLLWSKQFYGYDIRTWLAGDPAGPTPPVDRLHGRNHDWLHLYNSDVLSMPDKWEYPWYASWDLAFHTVALALIDPDFAKQQLVLLLREWYLHPNGQLPAYEWNFDNVNPPVHAWAAWRVYKIEQRITGRADRGFLERVFHKLLLNFTWWVNRKDPEGLNLFEGGFLGLDNIGLFDRSQPMPDGGRIEQSDGTSWMAMFSLNMMAIAMELGRQNPAYEDVASKFFEHFVWISSAMNNIGGQGRGLWDEQDGFYYNVLHLSEGAHIPVRSRTITGLIPLFATETLEPEDIKRFPAFYRRMNWFLDHHPEVPNLVTMTRQTSRGPRYLLSIANQVRLRRILGYMLDPAEFLSPHGIRSLSRYHLEHPCRLALDGHEYVVDYEPGESTSNLFGGNSNWRGPVWFPLNFLLIEALQKFHFYYGDDLKVECPTGSGKQQNLWEVASMLSRSLIRIFLRSADGRPVNGSRQKFQQDPHWRDLIEFHEYFHADTGEGLGASHQTGWTALVAKLIEQSGAGFC
jgi:Mannosylglycerate hydrolase MGH1-like glycoside hydrolase domain